MTPVNASERLDPVRTALLFFDMLNGHVKKNDAATKLRYAPVIAAAVRVLDAARRSGVVVMYAAAHHRPDNATSAHLVTDTDNRLRPVPAGRLGESKPVGQVVYSDGLAAVSVFIEPLQGRSEPQRPGLASMGAIHVYTRQVANHMVTVVGEAPAASVQRIGNAVEYRRP